MAKLLAWWDFEEAIGSTEWASGVASDDNYTLQGESVSVTETAKTGDRALTHDGSAGTGTTDDPPHLANKALLNVTSAGLSFSCWVSPHSLPATDSDWQTVFSKWDAATGRRMYVLNYTPSAWRLLFYAVDDGTRTSYEVVSDAAPILDEYTFIACWFDDENKKAGLQVNQDTFETSYTGTVESNTNWGFGLYMIGESSTAGWEGDVNVGDHKMDALNAWEGVLSASELDRLYNNGQGLTRETFANDPERSFNASYADASAALPKITALIRPADVQRSIDTDVSNLASGPNLYTVECIFDLGELSNLNPYNSTTEKPRVFFVKDDQPGLRDGKNLLLKGYQIRSADPSVPVTCTFWGY